MSFCGQLKKNKHIIPILLDPLDKISNIIRSLVNPDKCLEIDETEKPILTENWGKLEQTKFYKKQKLQEVPKRSQAELSACVEQILLNLNEHGHWAEQDKCPI